MSFQRPETSIYPQTYRYFVSNNEKFYIADLKNESVEDALDLIAEFVIPEENFCKAIQIHKKENAMRVMVEAYRDLFAKKMTLACYKDNGELVGLNVLGVKNRGEKSEEKLSVSYLIKRITEKKRNQLFVFSEL
jgi:hypothetical protein